MLPPPIVVALAALAGPPTLAAPETPVAVHATPSADAAAPLRIDCAALDRESRGALEARARAELAVAPEPAGTIVIVCDERTARVEWLAPGAAARQRVVALDPSLPTQAVDTLLDAVHELRLGTNHAPKPPPSPVAPASVPATTASDAELGITAASARRGRPVRLGIGVAARGELWRGSIPAAIEGEVDVRLSAPGGWSLTAAGTLGSGLETARSIQARTLGARIGIARTLDGKLDLAVGGAWLRLAATRSGGPAPEQQQQDGTFGAFASVRYVLARGPFSFAVGPEVTVLAAPILVDVEGGELFRIPRVLAGLSVAGSADVVR